MPSRKVPPSSDSARARKASGTRVVMNEWRARPKPAAQNPMRKTDAANTPSAGAKTMPDDADERERAGDRHREALADARDGPSGGDVAAQLADDQRGGDEGGGGDIGAELRRDDRDQRDDRALAEREQDRRAVDHRAEARSSDGRSARLGHDAVTASTLVWTVMLDFDLSADIQALRSTFADIRAVVDVDALTAEIARLSEEAGAPDLWDDTEKAQKVTSALSHRQSELARITSIDAPTRRPRGAGRARQRDGRRGQPPTRRAPSSRAAEDVIGDLEVQTLLDGEYDDRPAVITIRAGAGGVDAADFAEMLMRMYLRWAEQHKYPATVMDTRYAEEAGIKSATFEIDAPYAFGTLSVEAGTHRLVRMSPFGSAGKRQTSFAAVEVIPLMEEAVRRSRSPRTTSASTCSARRGPGGQSVNTTDSAVRLTHLPTGTVVSMQNEKSQIQNRAAAMRVLQSRLLILQKEQEAAHQEGARRHHHRELGRPDALLRARAVPDGQGPAHRLRGQQPLGRLRRRPRRLHRRRHQVAQASHRGLTAR